MAIYTKDGNNIRITQGMDADINFKLPSCVYAVNQNRNGFYLTKTDDFKLPERVFGNVADIADRIITTFKDRQRSTGVLLSGLKGSGKTLLSKFISIELLKQGFPVVLVNNSFDPGELMEFIMSIEDECVVIFDEFEKNYVCDMDIDQAQQDGLMTLFDGTIEAKKLYILTCNDLGDIHSMLLNRPGRMYYHIGHSGLSEDTIREFCNIKLNDVSHTESIVKIGSLVGDFSFDMLDVLVEEVNRYNITPTDALSFLNIKPESRYDTYCISVYRDDELLKVFNDVQYDPLYSDSEELLFYAKERKSLDMEGLDKYDGSIRCLSLMKDRISSVHQDTFVYNINEYKVVSKKVRESSDFNRLIA
ncbi:MAG: ATP-binding protein [Methanomassiliicoccaceae archaeon]|nr:ATP-binding protein [Methanomassiliicoccaceae archaeon]